MCNTLETYIGSLIRKKRIEKGLTQAQLADIVGTDEYYISKIETGKRKPGRKYLPSIANALEISSDYLFGLDSNIVFHESILELEELLSSLSAEDKECIINIVKEFVKRCDKKEQ